jgi:hypothetical protein
LLVELERGRALGAEGTLDAVSFTLGSMRHSVAAVPVAPAGALGGTDAELAAACVLPFGFTTS